MTKADRIRKLAAEGKSDAEIAEIVGCERSYVRTAARQRRNGRKSAGDANYAARCYDKGDREAARAARREAYAKFCREGFSPQEANQKAGSAYTQEMRRTARHG